MKTKHKRNIINLALLIYFLFNLSCFSNNTRFTYIEKDDIKYDEKILLVQLQNQKKITVIDNLRNVLVNR